MKTKSTTLVAILISLASCTKDWECCVEQTVTHTDPDYTQLNGTSSYCVDWRGTNDEKEQFEDDGTNIQYQTWPDNYTIKQETHCTPD